MAVMIGNQGSSGVEEEGVSKERKKTLLGIHWCSPPLGHIKPWAVFFFFPFFHPSNGCASVSLSPSPSLSPPSPLPLDVS